MSHRLQALQQRKTAITMYVLFIDLGNPRASLPHFRHVRFRRLIARSRPHDCIHKTPSILRLPCSELSK